MTQLRAVVLGFPPEHEGGLRRDVRGVQTRLDKIIADGMARDTKLKFIWGVAMFAAGKMSIDWIQIFLKWIAKAVIA